MSVCQFVGEGTRSRNGNVLFPCSSVEYGISVLTRWGDYTYPQYILSILQTHGQCAISNLADYCDTHRATWGCCSLPMFVWYGTRTWARVSMSASRTCKWYALCNIPSQTDDSASPVCSAQL